MTAPQIVVNGDTARTRLTDPANSHRAADRTTYSLRATKRAVLSLIHQEGSLSGEEVADLYSLRSVRHDWPAAKTDSPRKRAGELFADGYLLDIATDEDTCRVYCLSDKGLTALGVDL